MTVLCCPVCDGVEMQASVIKAGTPYFSCLDCHTLFAQDIASATLLTHNDQPFDRNLVERQDTRLKRLMTHLGRTPENLLDFGCGGGDYVAYLKAKNIAAVGVDQDTEAKVEDFRSGTFDVVNMVEVIEHLTNPLSVLSTLAALLKSDGILYIETSLVDFIGDPALSRYVDPQIGHCCIHSRKSIERMAFQLTLRPTWINNNVVVLHKKPLEMQVTSFWTSPT